MRRLRSWLRRLPAQLLALVLLMTAVTMGIADRRVSQAVEQHTVEHTTGMLEDLFLIFGHEVESEALLDDPARLQEAVAAFTREHPRLDTFFVINPQEEIVALSTNLPQPDRINLRGPAVEQALERGKTASHLEREQRSDRYPRLTVVVPLQTEEGTWLLMGKFSMVMDFENLAIITRRIHEALALTGLLLAVTLGLAIHFLVLRPVHCLTEVAQKVGAGNLGVEAHCEASREFDTLSHTFNEMIAGLRRVWERFLPPQLVARIIHDPESALELGGERREVTVLFGDVRNFTPVAAQMEPEAIVEQLNELFTHLTEIIFAHEGTLDKYLGDGVMAVFGAPFGHGDDPRRAVRCALEMQEAIANLQARWRAEGRPPLQMGIGLHTGVVVAGNIGSLRRMDYTVIGNTVNIAFRIMGVAAGGEVLISEATAVHLDESFTLEPLPPQHLKGERWPRQLYRVCQGGRDEETKRAASH